MSDRAPSAEGQAAAEPGLHLRRTVAQGFGISAVVTVGIFAFFVLIPGTSRSVGLYVGLAVVLWSSVGLLVTLALVGWRLARLPAA